MKPNFKKPTDRIIVSMDFPSRGDLVLKNMSYLKEAGIRWVRLSSVFLGHARDFARGMMESQDANALIDLSICTDPDEAYISTIELVEWGASMITLSATISQQTMEHVMSGLKKDFNDRAPIVLGKMIYSLGTFANKTYAVGAAMSCKSGGLDGVICSVENAPSVRQACGEDFLIIVPVTHILEERTPTWRFFESTPKEAVEAGAHMIIVPSGLLNEPIGDIKRIVEMITSLSSKET